MRKAIELAAIAKRCTAPNPPVGAVVVAADGITILGEGFHTGPGKPHAEPESVKNAESRGTTDFTGCTIYTTLEPCHRGPGKRTPPCDELIVNRGFRRCVIGYVDPDPVFGGAGVEFLEEKGIDVVVLGGVTEEEIKDSLRAYTHHR